MTEYTLPRTIFEELKKRADKAGVTIEEYLFDVFTEDIDPQEAVEKYIAGAEELLKQAREELDKGDLRQASEKIWGPAH